MERVTGSKEVSTSQFALASWVDLCELEGDAVVLGRDWSLSGCAYVLGDVRDLVATLLAFDDAATSRANAALNAISM